jgi:hypothetical protein
MPLPPKPELINRNLDHPSLLSYLVKQQPVMLVDERMRSQPTTTTRDVVVVASSYRIWASDNIPIP